MMNERIKLLLEQSGLQPYYDAQEWHIEKFAELLLEEMYDFIMDESAKDNGIPDLGTVKQHFGVEVCKC